MHMDQKNGFKHRKDIAKKARNLGLAGITILSVAACTPAMNLKTPELAQNHNKTEVQQQKSDFPENSFEANSQLKKDILLDVITVYSGNADISVYPTGPNTFKITIADNPRSLENNNHGPSKDSVLFKNITKSLENSTFSRLNLKLLTSEINTATLTLEIVDNNPKIQDQQSGLEHSNLMHFNPNQG